MPALPQVQAGVPRLTSCTTFWCLHCKHCLSTLQVGEFAKETGAICADGNRFKEHLNSKQHKRAEAREQELLQTAAPPAASSALSQPQPPQASSC